MPTGAGKSICYQIPALLMDGLSLVISPLISLMKDQVNALQEAGIPCAFLNSSLSYPEYKETLQGALSGVYKILYIAPERLASEGIYNIAHNTRISMVVVDEAHCVSQWGHDFRPSYLKIKEFIDNLNYKPVIGAFTATATKNVQQDIKSMLELKNPYEIVTGFDRTNLYYEVQRLESAAEKNKAVFTYIQNNPNKSGIIYCSKRKTVEEVCDILNSAGVPTTRYHAGLADEERHANQDDFIYDRKTVMVATNAFGMGIDKSNVSFVIHYNMPKNIESYYQEAGRAGRDGENADCILFYSAQDVHTNKYLIEHSENSAGIEDIDRSLADKLKKQNLELLKFMTFYSTTQYCLRSYILNYFGEKTNALCGHCSNCLTQFEETDITIEAKKIVSCVYRVEQRGNEKHGPIYFGKTMIIDILHGSKNNKVLEAGLNTLSTYGIMADNGTNRIRRILDYLIENDYLAISANEYPVVMRTEKSADVFKTDFSIIIKLPKAEKQTSARMDFYKEQNEDLNIDLSLFEKLKALRTKLASDAKIPAYIVFADASIKDMCIKKPVTKESFLNVSGVGKRKQEQYAEVFIAEIKAHLRQSAEATVG
ncbi:MAG: DNA helicase RecQ [Termitinemataceae bacterium]|nr:MAG: DNA helicase RecQ [Termitinemataceae bacterium]